ncbi:response regulator [Salinisphaera hydrothermalis]|uniref:response regulator n=1 Tax=Salinisphaera hydrothermalis TaxID=563188 RepID=UPI00334230EA
MSQTSPHDPSRGCAILYVDDEEMALKYFQRALDKEFSIYVATDANAGLDILEAHGDAIGVVVSDQRMPGLSGVELLKKVRRNWPHIVRILTTAYADLDDAIEAVNAGEIFRYITKPWETKALRAEMKQAASMFRLQQERTELIREKMSVWQRLIQLGRLRDLIVMGGSVNTLRYGDAAVAAYLQDHVTANQDDDLASSRHLDLWQLTETEISQTLSFVSQVVTRIADIANRDEPFATVIDAERLQQLVADAFPNVTIADRDRVPHIRGAEPVLTRLLEELATATGRPTDPVSIHPAHDDTAVSFSIPCAVLPTDSGLTSSDAAGLMASYLLAFHHGGRLELETSQDRRRYMVTLPADPVSAHPKPLSSGWLAPLLVRLEGWD